MRSNPRLKPHAHQYYLTFPVLAASLLNFLITSFYTFNIAFRTDAYPANKQFQINHYFDKVDFKSYSNASQTRPHRHKRSGLIDDEIKSTIECEPLDAPKNDKGESIMSICKKRLSWKDAHKACEDTVGHLAALLTRGDAEQLVESIFAKSFFDEEYDWGRKTHVWGLDRRYWIGLTDLMQEGKWTWVGTGKFLDYRTMWYPGQPDHVDQLGSPKGQRRQHCVSLWNPVYYKLDASNKPVERHTFDDIECEKELYFICQKDPAKITPKPP